MLNQLLMFCHAQTSTCTHTHTHAHITPIHTYTHTGTHIRTSVADPGHLVRGGRFLGCRQKMQIYDKNYQTEVTASIHTEPILDGKIIGQSVINMLVNKFHLSLENCVGVGTDGCTVMSSLQKGAVVEIQKVAVNAVCCPCYNHALNLTLSKSSNVDVQAIRNCLGVISAIAAFFNASAKRNFVIKNMLNSQLVSLCETCARWVET